MADEADIVIEGIEAVTEDTQDARSWTEGLINDLLPPPEARMPVGRDEEEYNMNHKYRGKAIIFNQKDFSIPGMNTRHGTDVDRDNLSLALRQLDFEVEIYNDLKLTALHDTIISLAQEDHSERDCLLIAVFSHGLPNQIYARDGLYKSDMLWDPFTAENCPTLAGKPKIFIIQACQGDQVDGGTIMKMAHAVTQTDSAPKNEMYKIPNRADFLMVFSTFPGYYSWRNTTYGSWFVQSICKALKKYGQHKELLALVTIISRYVALDFQSFNPNRAEMDQKKQVPFTTSTLIREVYFRPKNDSGECVGKIATKDESNKSLSSFSFKSLVRPTSNKNNSEVKLIPEILGQPIVPQDKKDFPEATPVLTIVEPKAPEADDETGESVEEVTIEEPKPVFTAFKSLVRPSSQKNVAEETTPK